MDKMKFETPDMTAENIEKIAELFPNCVTEMRDESGKIKRGINFEMLKQMLSSDVVDGDECYEFTWVGKKASVVEANKPIRKTLRPCPEESKDWDTTENLYIEGDNLEVLKLLQESYLGKVKMIYIDPPYNTGNDFIYADDFMRSQQEENEQMGMYDEDENRLFKNTDSNGRFHSDWCSMMYPRLLLARNLLADDGVIFISIDDNEQENLKKLCDEVFGSVNFVAELPTIMNMKGNNDEFGFAGTHEYTLVYIKNKNSVDDLKGVSLTEEDIAEYAFEDEKGKYKKGATLMRTGEAGARMQRPKGYYPIYVSNDYKTLSIKKEHDDDKTVYPIAQNGVEMSWRRSPEFLMQTRDEFIINHSSLGITFYKKQRLAEDIKKGKKAKSLFYKPQYSSGNGTAQIKELFDGRIFDNPKPKQLIHDMIMIGGEEDAIILDFFSGSATTAHAVMQLNAEDGGHRKFIMVQLPEPCDEQSEAYKAGYKNICEIGKERIRRAGEKILQEKAHLTNAVQSGAFQKGEAYAEFTSSQKAIATQDKIKQTLDVGFRVLKLADSNMKDVYYAADDYKQTDLLDMVSNIKDDRTDLDLLFGCLIDWGLPLSMPYTSEKIEGCTVHTYNDGDLIACFDNNIPESVIREIAKRKPLRAVFRDSGFADSPSKINVFEIFKLYMPEDADDISKRVRVI